jgi:hypothetical protein
MKEALSTKADPNDVALQNQVRRCEASANLEGIVTRSIFDQDAFLN